MMLVIFSILADMIVTYAASAFLWRGRHSISSSPKAQGWTRSFRSKLRNQAAMLGAAAILGDLREKDFHLSSSHFGPRGDGGSRRRALGYSGSGEAIAGTERGDDQASR